MTRLTTLNLSNPVGQAFWALRAIFTIAPILFGLDKFFNLLVPWEQYLAPWVPDLLNISPQTFMYGVGIIEITVGVLVAFWPEVFAYVVTLWLWGIIVNLLTVPGYYDIALRDFGLSIGALSLARLAHANRLERSGQITGAVPQAEIRPSERQRAA
jgi:hypothetical protein